MKKRLEIETLDYVVFFKVYEGDEMIFRKNLYYRGTYDHPTKIPGYKETLRSIMKNVLFLVPKKIVDYGLLNARRSKATPRVDKFLRDEKKNPWLCCLSEEIEDGSVTEVINYTYGFKYSYDSGD